MCLEGDSRDQPDDILDGSAIVAVGAALNNPLVKFIGKAFKNIENYVKTKLQDIDCRVPSCLNWSKWTSCVHIKGNFGIQNRSRLCGRTEKDEKCFPSFKAENNDTDYETRLCELDRTPDIKPEERNRKCSFGYNITEHGFCVKYFAESVSWITAQSNCEKDGGNLINIDSETKSNDIAKLLDDMPAGTIILIDGIRKSPESEWEYNSGIMMPTFSNWGKNEPNAKDFPNCRYVQKETGANEWKWYDYFPCSGTGSYMCELE